MDLQPVSRYRVIPLFVALFIAVQTSMTTPASAATIRESSWHLNALRIPEVHQITRGEGIVVAVVDSGVDSEHPDLQGRIAQGASFGSGPLMLEYDTKTSHGTMASGLIVGSGRSENSVLGIAPGAKVMPLAVDTTNGDYIASAIRWAADNGAKVINVSPRMPSATPAYWEAMANAVQYALERDVVVVAGAGNTYGEFGQLPRDVATPADIPGVVAVASTDQTASHWPESQQGSEVVVAAPGVSLVGTVDKKTSESGYAIFKGTDASAPIVAGVVALIRSKYPQLDAKNVVHRLIVSAKDQGAPGRDEYFGFGTVRPYDALTMSIPEVQAWPIGTIMEKRAKELAAGTRPVADSTDEDEGAFPWKAFWTVVGAFGVLSAVCVLPILWAWRMGRTPKPKSTPNQSISEDFWATDTPP